MDSGFWAILVIGGLLVLWGYGDLVSGSHKVAARARDQLHKERLAAIEKGLPPPDGSFDESLLAFLSDDGGRELDWRRQRASAYSWAIAFLLGGLGWSVATTVIPGNESSIGWLHYTWSFGLIPVLLGLGILLRTFVTRRG
jgi:hypothetical protein